MTTTDWQENLVEKRVTYTLEVGGSLVMVENVPARVNVETGEQLFSPETVEQLQALILDSQRVKTVSFTEGAISVGLMDGRIITVPLVWYPRLLNAAPEQRENWEICGGGYGLHWEAIDEDLSTEGMLRGAPAPGAVREVE